MALAAGFFTDTSVCIGCKAYQVACHQWNELPAENGGAISLSGDSYDNTRSFSHVNWRHVKFIEQITEDRAQAAWLMMSDVCKHCAHAPCKQVCPTKAIVTTEFHTVYIREEQCNGCRDCIAACPFGVIHTSPTKNVAQKCTFCYDRLQHELVPACAQACPTQSIQFGRLDDLRDRATARLAQLQEEWQEKLRRAEVEVVDKHYAIDSQGHSTESEAAGRAASDLSVWPAYANARATGYARRCLRHRAATPSSVARTGRRFGDQWSEFDAPGRSP